MAADSPNRRARASRQHRPVAPQPTHPHARAAVEPRSRVEALQRTAGNRAVTDLVGAESVPPTTGGGLPLEPAVRANMEARLGSDLGGVRLHTDLAAQEAASSIGAKAFTSGTHIWFGPGSGPTDRTLLSHELAHVAQQAQGRTHALRGLGGDPHVRAALERDASRGGAPVNGAGTAREGAAQRGPTAATPAAATAMAAAGSGVIQLQPTEGAVLKYPDQDRERRLVAGDEEFRARYVDNNIADINAVSDDPRANMLEAKEEMYTKIVVTYEDGRSVTLNTDDIPLTSKRSPYVESGGVRYIRVRLGPPRERPKADWYEMRDGIIYPIVNNQIAFSDDFTPDIVDARTILHQKMEELQKMQQLMELAYFFSGLIAASAGQLEAGNAPPTIDLRAFKMGRRSSTPTTTPRTTPRRTAAPRTGTLKGGKGDTPTVSMRLEPSRPAKPSKTARPAKPAKPPKPAKPSKPAKPAKPSKPAKPTTPAKPTKSTEPSKRTKPAKSAKTTKPAKATKPAKRTPAQSPDWNDPALSEDQAVQIYNQAGVKKPLSESAVRTKFRAGERFNPKTRRWSKPHKVRTRAPRAPTGPFMREQLAKISDPNHALHGLVVEKTGPDGKVTYEWRTTVRVSEKTGRVQKGRYPGAEEGVIVQAGHEKSYSSGAEQSYMLEDADWNVTLGGHIIESKGATAEKVAVIVEGVPVELTSLQQWERLGVVPKGTVAKATRR